MPPNRSFWRNVSIIGLIHVALLLGLARWSGSAKKASTTEILWMDGNAGLVRTTGASAPTVASEIAPTPSPPLSSEAQTTEESPDEQPALTSAKSEIELPNPTPLPTAIVTPTLSATPSAAPVAKPSPTATATPSRSPKATAKLTPKKKTVAKAATPSPKPKASLTKKKSAESDVKKVAMNPAPANDARPEGNSSDSLSSGGSGAAGRPGGGASQFSWYSSILHNRFFSEWVQPTSIVASGVKMSVLVRVRIEKDGRISDFAVVRPSGNVIVDESVAAVGKRVGKVDPPPDGLSGSGHYDVNINFELNPEQ